MKRTSRVLAALSLGAALAAGGAACSAADTAEADKLGIVQKLPEDTDAAQSKRNAEEFRSWVEQNGTGGQKEATARVDRVIGEWNEKTGNAYVSTDINGGETPVHDPEATATAVAEAFAAWQDSEQGFVSVYDVFGNAMITNHRY
ncbi:MULTISPECIES: hypothetical protein [Streptomyces]|uniref:hypothetical protein n=1 Tax=Streptomyces TaxID=1883 RepID=UPI002248D6FE|nr:hypothetical protein [Streptomyces sp. JHD 1]MCX2968045.1 hypothetical protein [Streptomyces sp. JHD 1]